VISLLNEISSTAFNQTKPSLKKKPIKQHDWFDDSCRSMKKEIRRSLELVNKTPSCTTIREKHYMNKKGYFRYLRSKKRAYKSELNQRIEDGKVLDWKAFDKLKNSSSTRIEFDHQDLSAFHKFFTTLYGDNDGMIEKDVKEGWMHSAEILQGSPPTHIHNAIENMKDLNRCIEFNELRLQIKDLKSGKSSSDDMICNEILKSLSEPFLLLLLKLFNACLEHGKYPWHNAIITPLHKKGDKYNPDNYRAIAVGSCIGKLFSSILLRRLIIFKRAMSPDPINQQGFTKGAQTLDHIFTLKTLIDKYKKRKQKLYCTFVDFRKAFDTVSRPALLYKLSSIGIIGNVYNVIKDMYCNSTCQLKLDGKMTDRIKVEKGTEQGHTLSPELFKTFVQDLSPLLSGGNCPELQNILLTHLLWADDLVIVALDLKTLQKHLTTLGDYCNKWGLLINFDKTNTVVFNDGSRVKNYLNQDAVSVQEHKVKVVLEYTYLGVVLNRNGSFTSAVESQRKKGLRALFGMRRYLSKNDLSHKALMKLFDILIKPVVSYGAPIWTPFLSITTKITECLEQNTTNPESLSKLIKSFASTPTERLHLKHLKWTMSSHKYTSNIVTWGDTGRIPLVIGHIKQSIKYMNRVSMLNDNNFASLAYLEQKELDLPWYKNCIRLHNIATKCATEASTDSSCPTTSTEKRIPLHDVLEQKLIDLFKNSWSSCFDTQSKLDNYRNIKHIFGKEDYLDCITNHDHRSLIFRLRASSHSLEIEKGRYNKIPREQRFCILCNHEHINTKHIEDEDHFLTSCTLYSDLRAQLLVGEPHQGTMTLKYLLKDMFTLANNYKTKDGAANYLINASIINKMYKLRTETMKKIKQDEVAAKKKLHPHQ
jgi:hypothetical protein